MLGRESVLNAAHLTLPTLQVGPVILPPERGSGALVLGIGRSGAGEGIRNG